MLGGGRSTLCLRLLPFPGSILHDCASWFTAACLSGGKGVRLGGGHRRSIRQSGLGASLCLSGHAGLHEASLYFSGGKVSTSLWYAHVLPCTLAWSKGLKTRVIMWLSKCNARICRCTLSWQQTRSGTISSSFNP